ncbi:nuclease-related domain-containing protein [Glutamicibacter arilaitensis]|uniref:nuclease-related domain-containing protein n=1 Tax=Glutamicibacter arilaitensis TaxID=256701 RepID=UPI003FD60E79
MGVTGIFGIPGTGLQDQTFARNSGTAAVGARFEERTAKILNEFSGQCAVLHDVRIPLRGVRANIDHILISGNRLLMLDTKAWAKGFYWTLPALGTLNGLTRASHVDKSLQMAHRAFCDLAGDTANVLKPTIAVWGSNGDVNVQAVRVDGASVINAHDLRTTVGKFISKSKADSADRNLFEKIKTYVVKL